LRMFFNTISPDLTGELRLIGEINFSILFISFLLIGALVFSGILLIKLELIRQVEVTILLGEVNSFFAKRIPFGHLLFDIKNSSFLNSACK